MNYIYTLKDYRCDKHCPYCITKILDNTSEEDVHLLEYYLQDLKGDYDSFILSGNGEPSLYAYATLKYIKTLAERSGKFSSFRIQTSGAIFHQKAKLSLFSDWVKEVTVVSCRQNEDKEFFKYPKDYFHKLPVENLRVNYTLLLSKFNSKQYLEDIECLLDKYSHIALKLLDTDDPWILENAVPYSFKEYLLQELNVLLGDPIYSKLSGRYVWTLTGKKVTMSYGKESGHDFIQIRE